MQYSTPETNEYTKKMLYHIIRHIITVWILENTVLYLSMSVLFLINYKLIASIIVAIVVLLNSIADCIVYIYTITSDMSISYHMIFRIIFSTVLAIMIIGMILILNSSTLCNYIYYISIVIICMNSITLHHLYILYKCIPKN